MALWMRDGLRVTRGTRGLRQRWRPDPTGSRLEARPALCLVSGIWPAQARSTAPFTHPGSEGMGSREWGQWQSAAAWKGGKAKGYQSGSEATEWSDSWQPWWNTSRASRRYASRTGWRRNRQGRGGRHQGWKPTPLTVGSVARWFYSDEEPILVPPTIRKILPEEAAQLEG